MSNKICTYRNHVKEYNYQKTAMQNETCLSSSSLHSNANSDYWILTRIRVRKRGKICNTKNTFLQKSYDDESLVGMRMVSHNFRREIRVSQGISYASQQYLFYFSPSSIIFRACRVKCFESDYTWRHVDYFPHPGSCFSNFFSIYSRVSFNQSQLYS